MQIVEGDMRETVFSMINASSVKTPQQIRCPVMMDRGSARATDSHVNAHEKRFESDQKLIAGSKYRRTLDTVDCKK